MKNLSILEPQIEKHYAYKKNMYVSSDAVICTTWNSDRMYSRYTYLNIKNDFFKKT